MSGKKERQGVGASARIPASPLSLGCVRAARNLRLLLLLVLCWPQMSNPPT